MCGIVGCCGSENTVEILINGLKKLEYRGYDSAGIAVFNKEKKVDIIKTKGRLSNLEDLISKKDLTGSICGIGHTRWATHGEPTDINSHPHKSGRVTVVHNGIIENYGALKEILIKKKHTFTSSTDTEVIAHLIDHYYIDNPIEAIVNAVSKLHGSYALGIMFDDISDTVYALRKDSPLIAAVGEKENFIASDIPAILSYTRDYYLLEEGEICVLKEGSITFYNEWQTEIKKELKTASWDIEAAEKCGFPHFMLKEIHEQPKAIRDTVYPRLECKTEDILKDELPDTENIKRIHIVACGSAMHAGLLGKYAIERLSNIGVNVDIASEFRYNPPIFNEGDAVILISQSGETADTLAALRLAKEKGIPTIAVVNVVGSSLSREADHVIYTWAGPEIAVATTKAYTSQIAVLYLIAIKLGLDKKVLTKQRANELIAALKELPGKIEEILKNEEDYQRLAAIYQNGHDIFFIGRGQDYAICQEGSLKLKEISYMHSEAYAAGELKHGTISLIYENIPVVAIATQKNIIEKTVSNVKETAARGAKIILVCQKGAADSDDFYHHKIEIPETDETIIPILTIVPLQIFAYYTAIHRGCDVDKPRNLAKSVTVE